MRITTPLLIGAVLTAQQTRQIMVWMQCSPRIDQVQVQLFLSQIGWVLNNYIGFRFRAELHLCFWHMNSKTFNFKRTFPFVQICSFIKSLLLDIYFSLCCGGCLDPGWWFQTFFMFHNIWDNPSHWLSYFPRWLKHVKTTNQDLYFWIVLKGKLFPWLSADCLLPPRFGCFLVTLVRWIPWNPSWAIA